MKTSLTLQEVLPLAKEQRILFYGIGNEGRQDDGIGIRLIEKLEQMSLPVHWQVDANYQLNAEVALQIADYQCVFFVDASKQDVRDAYYLEKIVGEKRFSFSTHAMSAASILGFCEQMYEASPNCFYIAVPGENWGIGEGLSAKAEANISKLVTDLTELLAREKACHA